MNPVSAGRTAKMADEWPKITLVMPSYKQAAYLSEAIQSVLDQNYPNLEFFVFDGGSEDGSKEIIEAYAEHIDYWQSEPDGGQAAALKQGFEKASGEIYCWLNSDDILLPEALLSVGRIFRQSSKTEFVYGNRRVIDSAGNVIGKHLWPYFISRYHWAQGQPLAQEACFWRAELYHKVGGLDESLYFVLDYDLFYRMWKAAKFTKTSQFLGCLRIHDDAKNSQARDVMFDERERAIQDYGIQPPGYFMLRLLNRLDRLQLKIEEFLTRNA